MVRPRTLRIETPIHQTCNFGLDVLIRSTHGNYSHSISAGWYIITYGLGIYVLNLLIGFLSPQMDPEQEGYAIRVIWETDPPSNEPSRQHATHHVFACLLVQAVASYLQG